MFSNIFLKEAKLFDQLFFSYYYDTQSLILHNHQVELYSDQWEANITLSGCSLISHPWQLSIRQNTLPLTSVSNWRVKYVHPALSTNLKHSKVKMSKCEIPFTNCLYRVNQPGVPTIFTGVKYIGPRKGLLLCCTAHNF